MSEKIIDNGELKIDNDLSTWKDIKLGDLGIVVTGKTPSKNNPEDWGDETLFITPSDYGNYRKWADDSIRKLSSHGVERLSNKVLPTASILVTCIGSDMGKVVMNKKDAVTNQQINSIISNTDIVNPDFVYYLLVDLYETLKIYGSDGTAVPIVNKGEFEKIDACIPPLPEQKAIAEVLSSLDDKIDLLHRQNKTLEQMAETLFRQWFVEEAKDDWEIVKIGDYLDVLLGGTPSTKNTDYWNGDIPWINSSEINKDRILHPTKMITKAGLENSSTKLLPKGTTVLAITGATLGQVSRLEIDACANQSVIGIIGNSIFSNEYIFLWIKYSIKEIISNQTGGAQQHINRNDIKNTDIIKPDKDIYEMFMKIVIPIFKKITNNVFQIEKLEALRNTLLPKLVSGDIKVSIDE